jgi:hypothetical protein
VDTHSTHDITWSGYSSLEAIKCNGGDFFNVHFADSHIYGLTFNNCVIHNTVFENCIFVDCSLTNVYLSDVTVSDCSFLDHLWCNGKLTNETLKKTDFENTTNISLDKPVETYDPSWLAKEKARITKELEDMKERQKNPPPPLEPLESVDEYGEPNPHIPPLAETIPDQGIDRVMAGWYALAAEVEKKNRK